MSTESDVRSAETLKDKTKKSSKEQKKAEKKEKKERKEKRKADDSSDVEADKTSKKKRKSSEKDSVPSKESKVNDGIVLPTPDDSQVNSEVSSDSEDATVSAVDPNLALTRFRLSESTLKALQDRGVTALFPIQAATFDHIFDGKDLLGRARTGTGKTLAFALPIVERLKIDNNSYKPHSHERREPRAVVLAPTRELAKQVANEFEMASAGELTILCVYGGVGYEDQTRVLKRGVDVVVGTPGRVQDHIDRGTLKLSNILFVCLDEADQMLDIGFKDAMEKVLNTVAQQKELKAVAANVDYQKAQTLLFSATLPEWVYQIVREHLNKDYITVDLIGQQKLKGSELVTHYAIQAHWTARKDVVGDVVSVYGGSIGRTIIFTQTKNDANELSLHPQLSRSAQVLHGDIPQTQREASLDMFRKGKCRTIICTDVAARGLDIPEVDLVINYDKPDNIETYIHRSGRTGRAGRNGVCVTFYKPQEIGWIRAVERRAGIKMEVTGAPGAAEVVGFAAKEAANRIRGVPDGAWKQFLDAAQELLQSADAEQIVGSALALIAGYGSGVQSRSLITAKTGDITLLFRTRHPIRHFSFIRSMLKRHYPALDEHIKAYRLLADACGCVCDITEDQVEVDGTRVVKFVNQPWKDSDIQAEVCVELPELEPIKEELHASSGGFRGRGGRGGRGGSRFGSNRGGGGARGGRRFGRN